MLSGGTSIMQHLTSAARDARSPRGRRQAHTSFRALLLLCAILSLLSSGRALPAQAGTMPRVAMAPLADTVPAGSAFSAVPHSAPASPMAAGVSFPPLPPPPSASLPPAGGRPAP